MGDGAKVYLDYTQEELDRQYEHRHIVPDVDDFIARSRAESARVRAAAKGSFDVAYGPGADEVLDILLADAADAPVVVFFHGGRWQTGGKDSNCGSAEAINAAGAHFVSVDFTLFPDTTMDELIRQCRAAVAWVLGNAASFGGDPARLYVIGKSSGAHIAAMMATTDWAAGHGLAGDAIKGGLLVSGMYDLEPVRLTFRNEWLRLDAAMAARNSPIRHIPDAGCPLIVGHGERETDEFKRQPRVFAEAWRAAGNPCVLVEIAGCHHFSIDTAMNDPASPLMAPFRSMMGLATPPRPAASGG